MPEPADSPNGSTLPAIPDHHAGEPLPQNAIEARAAAAAAAMEPAMPPGMEPPPTPPQFADDTPTAPVQRPAPPRAVAAAPARPAVPPPEMCMDYMLPFSMGGSMPDIRQQYKQRFDHWNASLKQKYYLVVIAETSLPVVEEFEKIDDLLSRMTLLLEQEAALFAFCGTRLKIGKIDKLRKLVTPVGNFPLYEEPSDDRLVIDDTGWVGKETQELEIVKQPAVEPGVGSSTVVGGTTVPAAADDTDTPVFTPMR